MNLYRTKHIAGKTRLTRPSSIITPMPSMRTVRQVNRYAHVRGMDERTVSKPSPRIWEPGMILTRA